MFRYTKWTFLREILVWVFTFIILSPLFILINVSLKSTEEFMTSLGFDVVKKPSIESFATVVTTDIGPKILDGMITSFTITVISVIGLIFFGSLTAYVLVRRLSKLSTFSFYLVTGGIVMPAQLGMVPLYIGFKNVGLLGNQFGMGLIYIMMLMPLAVLLYGGFVRSIPREFEEAAYIDGASKARTFSELFFLSWHQQPELFRLWPELSLGMTSSHQSYSWLALSIRLSH